MQLLKPETVVRLIQRYKMSRRKSHSLQLMEITVSKSKSQVLMYTAILIASFASVLIIAKIRG